MLLSSKRGVSLMVAYVLLISMAIALSVLVYPWLVGLVEGTDVLECPSGVSLVITDVVCDNGGVFDVTVANKGRFSVDDVVFRFSNSMDASFGVDQFFPMGGSRGIAPSSSEKFSFQLPPGGDLSYKDVKVVDLQPVKFIDGVDVVCKSYTVRRTDCSP